MLLLMLARGLGATLRACSDDIDVDLLGNRVVTCGAIKQPWHEFIASCSLCCYRRITLLSVSDGDGIDGATGWRASGGFPDPHVE